MWRKAAPSPLQLDGPPPALIHAKTVLAPQGSNQSPKTPGTCLPTPSTGVLCSVGGLKAGGPVMKTLFRGMTFFVEEPRGADGANDCKRVKGQIKWGGGKIIDDPNEPACTHIIVLSLKDAPAIATRSVVMTLREIMPPVTPKKEEEGTSMKTKQKDGTQKVDTDEVGQFAMPARWTAKRLVEDFGEVVGKKLGKKLVLRFEWIEVCVGKSVIIDTEPFRIRGKLPKEVLQASKGPVAGKDPRLAHLADRERAAREDALERKRKANEESIRERERERSQIAADKIAADIAAAKESSRRIAGMKIPKKALSILPTDGSPIASCSALSSPLTSAPLTSTSTRSGNVSNARAVGPERVIPPTPTSPPLHANLHEARCDPKDIHDSPQRPTAQSSGASEHDETKDTSDNSMDMDLCTSSPAPHSPPVRRAKNPRLKGSRIIQSPEPCSEPSESDAFLETSEENNGFHLDSVPWAPCLRSASARADNALQLDHTPSSSPSHTSTKRIARQRTASTSSRTSQNSRPGAEAFFTPFTSLSDFKHHPVESEKKGTEDQCSRQGSPEVRCAACDHPDAEDSERSNSERKATPKPAEPEALVEADMDIDSDEADDFAWLEESGAVAIYSDEEEAPPEIPDNGAHVEPFSSTASHITALFPTPPPTDQDRGSSAALPSDGVTVKLERDVRHSARVVKPIPSLLTPIAVVSAQPKPQVASQPFLQTAFGLPLSFYVSGSAASRLKYNFLIEKLGGGHITEMHRAMFVVVNVGRGEDGVRIPDEEVRMMEDAMLDPSRAVVTASWIEHCSNVCRLLDHREYAMEMLGGTLRQIQPTPPSPKAFAELTPKLETMRLPSKPLSTALAQPQDSLLSPAPTPPPPRNRPEVPVAKIKARSRKSTSSTPKPQLSQRPAAKKPRRSESTSSYSRSTSSEPDTAPRNTGPTPGLGLVLEYRPTLRSDLNRVDTTHKDTYLGIDGAQHATRSAGGNGKKRTWETVHHQEDIEPDDEVQVYLLADGLNIWIQENMQPGWTRTQAGWDRGEFLAEITASSPMSQDYEFIYRKYKPVLYDLVDGFERLEGKKMSRWKGYALESVD